MKRAKNIFNTIFISPECCSVVILYALLYYFPVNFELIGNYFQTQNKYTEYITLLPSVFTGLVFNYAKNIQFPEEKRKALYQWDYYYLIRDRVIIGVLISSLCAISSLCILLFQNSIEKKYIAFGLLSTIVVSGICAFTMFLASLQIREILISTNDEK